MKITTKIAKNGAVNIYLDGKRVKEEIAVDTLCDNGGKIYFADIHGYTGHTITATFASSISAYKWLIKMGNKSINYADGSWLIDCKDYKTGEIVTILEKDERDYVINDPQLEAFCNGEILEVTQEVVTDDAEQEPQVAKFEVGKTYFVILDGQTITAKVEDRTAKMLTATTNEGTRKYHIHEAIDAEHINLNGEGLMIWAQCEFTTQNVNAAKAELQADTEPEVDTSEYAVTEDALEVAVNAEIQNANTAKINDLKWEIRYTEGSINDLDKNHIAHFPNDQSLKERRADLLNELDNLKAQLADLLPAEIQAANNEADTAELSDEEIAEIKRRSQINAIKSRIATYERAIERQYDQELENSLIAAKAQLADLLPNEILQTGKMVSPEPNTDPEADHIANTGIKEEQPMTIEIPAEGTHEFTIGDDTVCFFNGKFHSVFSAKYHMAIVRDLVGCFSYCIYNDGDTEVFNVREHAVSYDNFMETLHQRGNREKLLALRKDYIITDRLSENSSSLWYINGKRSSHIKVWNLLQEYGLTLAEFLAEDEAYINECIAASCKKIAIKKQADFLYDKIKRECAPIDDSTTDRDEVFSLLPNIDEFNGVELHGERGNHKLVSKWNETLFDPEFKHGTAKMIFTMQGREHQAKIVWYYISVGYGKGKYKFRMGTLLLGKYDTPAQVEKVIDLLKAAITRGDKAFTFPTVDELIDPPELPTAKPRTLRDSINRAIKQCCKNRIGYLKSHNSKMEKYEYELLCLLQGARRELEVA